MKQMYARLEDQGVDDPLAARGLVVRVTASNEGVFVYPEGHGCLGSETFAPVLVELYNGKCRISVWGNPDDEDPTVDVTLEPLNKCPCATTDVNK
jgi:hypothetical protein